MAIAITKTTIQDGPVNLVVHCLIAADAADDTEAVLIDVSDYGSGTPDSPTPDGTNPVKVMAIDQNDSPYFHRKLKKDKENTPAEQAGQRRRKIGIYDLSNNMFTIQGANKFSEEDLKEPELQKLIGEAKFLNGEITYSEKQLEHFGGNLQQIGKKVGFNVLQSLFCDHILQLHPLNRKCLNNKVNPKPIAKLLGITQPATIAAV